MSVPNRYNRIAGKHVLVIGGTAGIGLSVAKLALGNHARVTISSSSSSRISTVLEDLRKEFPVSSIQGYSCDLGNDDVESNLESLFRQSGSVDHVVYTAADRLLIHSLEQLSREDILRATKLRMVAPMLLGKIAARHLKPTADSSLTLTTGAIKDRPSTGWTITATLGSGLAGMVQNLALEMRPIRVNGVSPGFVNTSIWDDMMSDQQKQETMDGIAASVPVGRVADPDIIAESYLYAMKDWNLDGVILSTSGGALLV